MNETEAELRGRLQMLETLVGVMLSQIAARLPDPARAIRDVMENAEAMIEIAARQAADDEKRAAEFAQAAFDQLSGAMLTKIGDFKRGR